MALRGTAIPDYLTNENITGVSGLTEVGYMTRDADGTIDVRTQPSIPPVGRYYPLVQNSSGNINITAQRIYAYPLDWTLDKKLDGLAVNVAAGPGNGIRFALYNSSLTTGLPDGLLVAKPTFTSIVGANVQVFNQPLKFQQRIWVAFVGEGGILTSINGPGKLGTSIALSSINDAGVYKGTAALAFPVSFGTPDGFIPSSTGPQMWWSNTLT